MTTQSLRNQTILRELEEAAAQYNVAKERFEVARVEYEIARERFSRTKVMAAGMIGGTAWFNWRRAHANLQYAGTPMGDAITQILDTHAWTVAAAFDFNNPKHPYQPSMNLEGIARALEEGGYEFNSTTPLRETNAALMNLKGITKTEYSTYHVEGADTILGFFREAQEETVE